MKRETEEMLLAMYRDLAKFDKTELLRIIDVLALSIVEDYIDAHPLPEGTSGDDMRAVMLAMRINEAVKTAADILRDMCQNLGKDDEERARVAAEAAIAKAQGKSQ